MARLPIAHHHDGAHRVEAGEVLEQVGLLRRGRDVAHEQFARYARPLHTALAAAVISSTAAAIADEELGFCVREWRKGGGVRPRTRGAEAAAARVSCASRTWLVGPVDRSRIGIQAVKNSTKTMESSKSQSLKKGSDVGGPRFDHDDFSSECASNQVVVFNSEAVDKEQHEHGENHSPSLQKSAVIRGISPTIGAYTVQCAKCFKWRLIPTKEMYEEIRACIIQQPFVCKRAREWKPNVTCDDPEDISQDGSRLWAIDKPNIAQSPPGWERQIRIRGEGGTKFADVYYTSPTGRKLRSLVEIDRYLQENPEYVAQGITLAQFSFQIPRPLRQDYVKKKAKLTSPGDEASTPSKSIQPEEVNPISWAVSTVPEGNGSKEASHPDETLRSEEVELTRKRKAGSTLSGGSNQISEEPKPKLEDAQNGESKTHLPDN